MHSEAAEAFTECSVHQRDMTEFAQTAAQASLERFSGDIKALAPTPQPAAPKVEGPPPSPVRPRAAISS